MPSPFPCELELTVASALLLLSDSKKSPTPSIRKPPYLICSDDVNISMERSLLGESNSCSSSLTNKGPSYLSRERRRKITAVVTRCREIKLNFVQKRRSKTMTRGTSGCRETTLKKGSIGGSVSETMTEGSCLSSGSSGVTNARSRSEASGGGTKKGGVVSRGLSSSTRQQASRRKPPIVTGSAHVHRVAEAILKLLSGGGCASEVRIRQLLGDTPDTSKALRMLLKMEEVKRYGAGGRADPYIYRSA